MRFNSKKIIIFHVFQQITGRASPAPIRRLNWSFGWHTNKSLTYGNTNGDSAIVSFEVSCKIITATWKVTSTTVNGWGAASEICRTSAKNNIICFSNTIYQLHLIHVQKIWQLKRADQRHRPSNNMRRTPAHRYRFIIDWYWSRASKERKKERN